jgi:hypothetical protein
MKVELVIFSLILQRKERVNTQFVTFFRQLMQKLDYCAMKVKLVTFSLIITTNDELG